MMMVLPWVRFSVCSRPRISSAVVRSRSPVGSSQTRIVGSDTSARAMATRCCWPPDNSPGLCLARSAEADDLERRLHARLALGARQRGQQQRQLDVALGRQHRHQVVELEHEAHVPRPPLGEIAPGELVDPLAGHRHLALGRLVEAADEIEQRRLAGARRAPSAPGTRRSARRGSGCAEPPRSACRACSASPRCAAIPPSSWSCPWLHSM